MRVCRDVETGSWFDLVWFCPSEWKVLYVILTSLVLMVLVLSVGWTFVCCCKR